MAGALDTGHVGGVHILGGCVVGRRLGAAARALLVVVLAFLRFYTFPDAPTRRARRPVATGDSI